MDSYKTNYKDYEIEYDFNGEDLYITHNKEHWSYPPSDIHILALLKDIDKYKKEILEMRGKLHRPCPSCYEDCVGWVSDGIPCGNNW